MIHFLTPHLATRFKDDFYDRAAFISTIHHIENDASIEPAGYSDAIMTVSKQWHDELIKTGLPDDKLVMVQNGIITDLFRPVFQDVKFKLREKYKVPRDAFIVGFSAKRDSDSCGRKGVEVLEELIKTTSDLSDGNIAWFLRGPGWDDVINKLRMAGAKVYYSPFLENDAELAESYQILRLICYNFKN